jgi:hypothetical protein
VRWCWIDEVDELGLGNEYETIDSGGMMALETYDLSVNVFKL